MPLALWTAAIRCAFEIHAVSSHSAHTYALRRRPSVHRKRESRPAGASPPPTSPGDTYDFNQLIDHNSPDMGTFLQPHWHTYDFYEQGTRHIRSRRLRILSSASTSRPSSFLRWPNHPLK
ncbi:hypothetical protein C8Q76DRAFT_195631 [Earliella scabrosa]|nr:hypothetical protein C8Q76DRAFT_195631 [Earliella scabrosa]